MSQQVVPDKTHAQRGRGVRLPQAFRGRNVDTAERPLPNLRVKTISWIRSHCCISDLHLYYAGSSLTSLLLSIPSLIRRLSASTPSDPREPETHTGKTTMCPHMAADHDSSSDAEGEVDDILHGDHISILTTKKWLNALPKVPTTRLRPSKIWRTACDGFSDSIKTTLRTHPQQLKRMHQQRLQRQWCPLWQHLPTLRQAGLLFHRHCQR